MRTTQVDYSNSSLDNPQWDTARYIGMLQRLRVDLCTNDVGTRAKVDEIITMLRKVDELKMSIRHSFGESDLDACIRTYRRLFG